MYKKGLKMASKVRVASVQPEIQKIIDEGAEVDQQMKNLESQDEAIKSTLRDIAGKIVEPDEKSVNLDGNKAMAMVSKKESVFVKFDTETDKAEFLHHICNGDLSDVIKVSVSVDVNSARVSELLKLLKEGGYDNELKFELNKKSLDIVEKTSDAGKVLNKCVGTKPSFAVKYSFKE